MVSPPIPPVPPDPPEPTSAGTHAAAVTATLVTGILFLLHRYVWHGEIPDQVGWMLYPVVSYAVSLAAARIACRLHRGACTRPPGGSAGP